MIALCFSKPRSDC